MQTRRGWSRAVAVSLIAGVMGCGVVEQGGAGVVERRAVPAGAGEAWRGSAEAGAEPVRLLADDDENGTPLHDPENPFFQSLGPERPRLQHLSRARGGMSITPEFVRRALPRTDGLDPLFRTVTGPPLRSRTCPPSPPAATPSGFSSTGG